MRTLEECLGEAAADLTVQTALIEARLLVGDDALFSAFDTKFRNALDPQAFYHTKRVELEERYLQYRNLPYSLEGWALQGKPGGLLICRPSSGSPRPPATATAGAT